MVLGDYLVMGSRDRLGMQSFLGRVEYNSRILSVFPFSNYFPLGQGEVRKMGSQVTSFRKSCWRNNNMSPEVTGFLLVLAAGLSTGGEPADPLASLGVSLWKEFFTGTLDASLSLCLVCVCL